MYICSTKKKKKKERRTKRDKEWSKGRLVEEWHDCQSTEHSSSLSQDLASWTSNESEGNIGYHWLARVANYVRS